MAFYDIFEKLCAEMGITPTQVARDTDIKQSVVAMWKKRGSTPNGPTLTKLSTYFGVTTDYLLGKPNPYVRWDNDEFRKNMRKNVELDKKVKQIGQIKWTPELIQMDKEIEELISDLEAHKDDPSELKILQAYHKLNFSGQCEAVKRVEELTEIPRYCAETAPQGTVDSTDSKDTPTTQNLAEGPQEPEEGE